MILTPNFFSTCAANTFNATCAKGRITPKINSAINSDAVPDARLGKIPASSIGANTMSNARLGPSSSTVRPAKYSDGNSPDGIPKSASASWDLDNSSVVCISATRDSQSPRWIGCTKKTIMDIKIANFAAFWFMTRPTLCLCTPDAREVCGKAMQVGGCYIVALPAFGGDA